MTLSDDGSDWSDEEEPVNNDDLFVASATGRTARKYLGFHDDAQDVIEWVEKSGASAELEDTIDTSKKLWVTNAVGGSVVEVRRGEYLVLDNGVFSVADETEYEPDPWDGTEITPSEE